MDIAPVVMILLDLNDLNLTVDAHVLLFTALLMISTLMITLAFLTFFLLMIIFLVKFVFVPVVVVMSRL